MKYFLSLFSLILTLSISSNTYSMLCALARQNMLRQQSRLCRQNHVQIWNKMLDINRSLEDVEKYIAHHQNKSDKNTEIWHHMKQTKESAKNLEKSLLSFESDSNNGSYIIDVHYGNKTHE